MPDRSFPSTTVMSKAQAPRQPTRNRAVEGVGTRVSAGRYMLAGLALLILPFLAIAHQSYRIDNGILVRLPVEIGPIEIKSGRLGAGETVKLFSQTRLTTPLNRISTNIMAGHNFFRAGEAVFVFLSPGPSDIWYPYAVSKRPPAQGCQAHSCLVLSGHIQSVDQDILNVRYQYEAFVVSPQMVETLAQALARPDHKSAEVLLSVGQGGHTTVRSLLIDGQTLRQRTMPMSALLGLSHSTANAAPME
ncbi:MAG: hypothetical protein COA69_14375 [Robiginitomaculum sp.]|nr:MAG: hypothetical protein COA69_14375 [Robiginitomaculum sp.]